jgi:hypothetical protein
MAPVAMSRLTSAPADVAAGGSGNAGTGYTCVRESTGVVRCIGDGGLGQLGAGYFLSSTEELVEVSLRD